MNLLVIIPAFNEFKTIAGVVQATKQYIKDILVIDDHSTDNTAEKAGCKVLRNDKNMGKGFGLKRGFKYAIENNYDAVITLDADGEHDPSEIPRFLEALKTADLVVGQRNIHRSRERTFLNWFSSFFMKQLLPNLEDTQSGYRAIRVGFLKKMKFTTDRFDLELEMLLEAAKHNARIHPLPLQHKPIAKSHQTIKDYIRINNLFDTWYLANARFLNLPLHRKIFLYAACFVGISIGKVLEKVL